MIQFGSTLRQAREARGYTLEQIAETTHILTAILSDLENNIFERIPAPIYCRGFIKLYCSAVGLDPQPLLEAYQNLLEHPESATEAPAIEAAEPPPPPPPMAVPPPQEPPQASPAPQASDLFAEPIPAPEPAPEPAPMPEPQIESEPPKADPLADHSLSRYASPFQETDYKSPTFTLPHIPAAVWRLAVLGIIVALLLWGIIAGLRTLYASGGEAAPTAPTEGPREKVAVPQLYLN